MRTALLIALSVLLCDALTGQVIYVSSSNNAIYRLNLDDCTYTFVAQVDRQVYDLSFHPDGSLYGISGNGNFFSIDINTGSTTILHMFGGQIFNSLTVGADGLVYTIGNDGELWTYDLTTDTATFLGAIGYGATGDLTFYKGQLYAAATGDRIVRINLGMVQNSTVVINENIPGNILGIVSDVVDCTEINCYAITNGMSDIYLINFMDNSLQLVCELNITVGGGASTSEFLASSPLEIDTSLVTDPNCKNENGSVSVEVSGGAGSYTYSLNGGAFQSSNIFTGLSSGTYTVIVEDQLGCQDTIAEILANAPPPSLDNVLQHPSSCGKNNGSLTLEASGGTGPYLFSLNGGLPQLTNVFTGLFSGTYTAIVTDQIGCTDSLQVFLTQTAAPTIDTIIIQQSTCGQDNGSILALGSGGNGLLLYSLDSLSFQSTGLFDSLGPARYNIFVMDSAGCIVRDEALIDSLAAAAIILADITHTSCADDNGIITIHTSVTSGVTYSIDGSNFQADNQFENLAAKPYLLIIQDENGCYDSLNITVSSSEIPAIDTIITTPVSCGQQNGSLTILAIGGTGTYLYSIDGNTFQADSAFTDLSNGIYNIQVMDEDGCTNMASAELSTVAGLHILSITSTPSLCGDHTGTINIDFEGGLAPVRFYFGNLPPQTDSQINDLAAGTYQVEIVDAAGCSTDTMMTIAQTGCPVYIPNVFSPNGDGKNDFFQIQTADENNVTITKFYIFDRWGNNVYKRFDFPIHSTEGWWDGSYKHFTMNPGVYAYYLEIEFENGERETFKGNVTLIR